MCRLIAQDAQEVRASRRPTRLATRAVDDIDNVFIRASRRVVGRAKGLRVARFFEVIRLEGFVRGVVGVVALRRASTVDQCG